LPRADLPEVFALPALAFHRQPLSFTFFRLLFTVIK